MAPVLSQEDQQSKGWWSLNKQPSTKDLRQAYSQGKPPTSHTKSSGKLNSLATAIGFKSKKTFPNLAIQDPPTPVIDIPRPDIHATNNIPPHTVKKHAPSVLTRSRANSTAPQTPVEPPTERRNSLMTLSDADPFAGRPMATPPIAHMPDPSRLSAYSSPSVASIAPKKADTLSDFNRVSYASSSSNSNSNSHGHAMDSSATSSVSSPTGAPEHRSLNSKRSVPSLQSKRPEGMYRQASLTPASVSSPRSGGTSPVRAAPPPSTQSSGTAPLRPKMRARGMTDSGTLHRPAFFLNDPPVPRRQLSHKASSDFHAQPADDRAFNEASSSKSPKVIVRQPSVPRMHTAPTAPPSQRLPPPPMPGTRADGLSAASRGSASSSNWSRPWNTQESDTDSLISFAHGVDSGHPPRSLKKSISQSSLKSRHTHGASSTSTAKFPEDVGSDKSTRKPRIFPHPRLPIPPLPLSVRPATSPGLTSFPSTSDSGQSPVSQKRTSQFSTGRKRLFSNSSRLSANTSPTSREDDTHSIFSLRSDVDAHLSHFKPWLTTPKSNSAPSLWDEERPDLIPNSPIFPAHDFAPQSIISPADVEKLEATVENHRPEGRQRARGFSVLSASTIFSDFSITEDVDSLAPGTLSPPPLSRPSSKQMSIHDSPMRREKHSRPGSPTLSSFHDERSAVGMSPVDPFPGMTGRKPVMRPFPPPSNPGMTSLPPPPRRGRKATLVSQPDIPEMAVAPAIATTLPLTINKASSFRANSKASLEKPSLEKPSLDRTPSAQTLPLMKKPSFLDIDDDEPEPESDIELPQTAESFLDFARESFDTTR